MTIADKLTIIKNSVQNIKDVLANKGVTYGDITILATAIDNMQTSSGTLPSGYTQLQYLQKTATDTSYIDL